MARKQRKRIFLLVAVLSLGGIVALINFSSPEAIISIGWVSIPSYIILFPLIFVSLYSLTAYAFRSFIHGILLGIFPVVYLTMRMNELTSMLFLVLLAAIFITLEILLVQLTRIPAEKKKEKTATTKSPS